MNDCLGSRNETNQKMLFEEKKKKTIVSTYLGEFNAGDKMTQKRLHNWEKPRRQAHKTKILNGSYA
ncbi:hypothetical protein SFRURICE_020698 [Spodoptera frugiperda]|nr:hypothetical protein SFRURICE_020698 [Spodoptera frugiperda]